MKENDCINGCKVFTGGEIKHHKDCPNYPESLSKAYDDLVRYNNDLVECITAMIEASESRDLKTFHRKYYGLKILIGK